MIGLGTWEAPINTMIFKGTGRVTVGDNNGEYSFKIELIGKTLPEVKVENIVENGNTLSAIAECDILPGKKIPVSVTFNADTCVGTVKAPIIGKIKFNGKKVSD